MTVMITVVNAEFAKSKQHHPKISLFFTGGNTCADGAFDADDDGTTASLMRSGGKPPPPLEASGEPKQTSNLESTKSSMRLHLQSLWH